MNSYTSQELFERWPRDGVHVGSGNGSSPGVRRKPEPPVNPAAPSGLSRYLSSAAARHICLRDQDRGLQCLQQTVMNRRWATTTYMFR